jgi:hypothetical protein
VTTFSIFLDNNNIDGESLKTALNSLSSTPANIFMYLEVNNVTVVPGQLFSSVGTDAPVAVVYFPSLNIDLRYNPISSGVNSSAFTAGATGANLDAVTLWLDYPTAGAIQFDGPVGFDGVTWVRLAEDVPFGAVGGSFTLSLCGTGVDLSVAKTLGIHNPPNVLTVVLQGNGYTDIPSGALSDTILNRIDLSNNFITQVAQDVFTYNFDVQALDLSNNRLGVVLTGTLNTLPVLGNFQIHNNPIWVIQQTNTHLSSGSNVLGSNCILQYKPTKHCSQRVDLTVGEMQSNFACKSRNVADGPILNRANVVFRQVCNQSIATEAESAGTQTSDHVALKINDPGQDKA